MAMQYNSTRKKFYAPQFNALAYANINGVLSGCNVTAQSPQAMGVSVASGRIFFANDTTEVSSGDLSIDSNTSSYERIDLVAVETDGTLSVLKGTPTTLPTPADYDPEVYVILAIVFISPTTTEITNDNILDNRVLNIGGGSSASSGGAFARKRVEFTSQTSVTVQHNLADDEPFVFVYDDTDTLIEPESLTIDSVNALTVEFGVSTSGVIIIYGGVGLNNGFYKTPVSGSTTYTITHNLDNEHVIVSAYDDTGSYTAPSSITLTDRNSLDVTFGTTFSGYIVCSGGVASENYIQNMDINSKTTAYSLIQDDNNSMIKCDGTFTVTLPDGLTEGFQCLIVNYGTGTITIDATTTLRTKFGLNTLDDQYSSATAIHLGSNEWIIFGDLS